MRFAGTIGALLLVLPDGAFAGPKDEASIGDWLIPKSVNDTRADLSAKGIEFGAAYIGDVITNTSGGTKRGTRHMGRFHLYADLDLEKMAGWHGTAAHVGAFHIYGQGLSRYNLGNLATVSEIEALPDYRLYEAWIEKTFLNGAVSLKVGQQIADADFFDSQTDNLFINSTFGWPVIVARNMPAGGPAPPIALPGIRLSADLSAQWTVSAAVFNGDPAFPGVGEPQLRDRRGTAFRLKDDTFAIGQLRYEYEASIGSGKLPANISLGTWYHTGNFDSQLWSIHGGSIADPRGSGTPKKQRGNYGVYSVFEQMLLRPPQDATKSAAANDKGVTAFARVAYAPGHHNMVGFYADAGIGFNNMLPARPDDRFGFAVAYIKISREARQFDYDTQVFSGVPGPARLFEVVAEAIYEIHVKQGWFVQPYFQYIVRPSGGIADPSDPTGATRIRNATIFGLTTTIRY